ncbi:MAG: nucleoside deaminase [Alphaproteobacteria bacterium]|nr:MAG: nucleoside deaminase [Alphaproteobacteria bacterium]
MSTHDAELLRRTFAVARDAARAGNLPFGAVLADRAGTVLLEAGNISGQTGDWTDHAELCLVRKAFQELGAERLAGTTLYSSAEPCAMCAGAIAWAGIRRLVYAMGGEGLYDIVGRGEDVPGLYLPCRAVLATANRPVAVTGPMLEDEAAALYRGLARWGM